MRVNDKNISERVSHPPAIQPFVAKSERERLARRALSGSSKLPTCESHAIAIKPFSRSNERG